MTRFVFSAHTYPDEPENWLQPPVGKYLEIMQCAMEPHEGVRQIDLCCGLGFGKTLLAIQIAVLKLDRSKKTRILFLEPDWDRVRSIFLDTWEEHVPPELYRHEVTRQKITWIPTGATLHYKPRVITGSLALKRDRRRGPEYTDVIDDETAIGFDRQVFTNTLARVRKKSDCRTYITLTTPQVGAYGRFLKRGGNVIFKGRTADNHYLLKHQPDYETNLRAAMSEQQASRELDGNLVALEGRIWNTTKYSEFDPDDPKKDAWPHGNRNDIWTGFRPDEPWWLFSDFGSATGSYVVVQAMDPVYRGHEMYNGELVWVAVADFCPDLDASASRAFQRLKKEFGIPVAVTGGKDFGKTADTDGRTISKFASNIFGENVQIFPCDESVYNKQMQFDSLTRLMCTTIGDRRFTIARDFVSLDTESHRGVREMIDEDQYPPIEKRVLNKILPKDKDNVVQHTRDALLMGAVAIMDPPHWAKDNNPAA
jgi:hypothetical protein